MQNKLIEKIARIIAPDLFDADTEAYLDRLSGKPCDNWAASRGEMKHGMSIGTKRKDARTKAQDAIAAVEAEDWQLVPVEPTAEMVEAGFLSLGKDDDASVLERDVYRAMLAAAPKPVATDGWQTMDSAPRDGTVIQAWHKVHKCPVSVLWKGDGFPCNGERLNWCERSYTTAWPERAFTHWRHLPAAPEVE